MTDYKIAAVLWAANCAVSVLLLPYTPFLGPVMLVCNVGGFVWCALGALTEK